MEQARHGSASPTSAMHDVYEGRRGRLREIVAAVPLQDGQVGSIAAINGEMWVLDYVSRPDVYAALHERLVQGYGLDALAEQNDGPADASPEDSTARGFALLACEAPIAHRAPGIGLGEEIRFAANGVSGSGLAHEGELIHLSVFPGTRGQRGRRRGGSAPGSCAATVAPPPDGRASPMAPDPAQDPPPSGWVLCPGCRQRSGPPGALCPDCGSRLPQPQKAESAGALLAIGLVVGAIGYAIYAASGHGSFGAVVLLIGIIVFGVGLAQGSDVAGRIGPERQASCCGCSCAVALLVVPVGAALLWTQGGPALAALAVPAWAAASHGSWRRPRDSVSRFDRLPNAAFGLTPVTVGTADSL